MLEAYNAHVAERAALGIPALPLTKDQTAELIGLLKNPPKGKEAELVDLITYRVPAGVDAGRRAVHLVTVLRQQRHRQPDALRAGGWAGRFRRIAGDDLQEDLGARHRPAVRRTGRPLHRRDLGDV